jgi:N-acetyl-anhydromuramyl-L-alanine amidase AmpD|tara:strand:+ start:797 stop:1681 length:885 start_codon:yes stop_codon:yes gene_type:complete
MNQIIKLGFTGGLVESLQEKLNLKKTGVFDQDLLESIKLFQKNNNLKQDGIVGYLTWKHLNLSPDEIYADTDASTSATWITQYNLPSGEFVDEETHKDFIILHSNHGTLDPHKQIDLWATDQRGRVGSHYVIGGPNSEKDGLILQAIKDHNWGYHLGPIKNTRLQQNSISIELCSFGPLEHKDNKYFNWYGLEVDKNQVGILEHKWNGYKYFHKYSEAQIESLKALLLLIKNRHGVNLSAGLHSFIKNKKSNPFEYNLPGISINNGVLSHSNIDPKKSDLFPQIELIEMLRSIK